MVQRLPAGYAFDPADPREPTDEQWEAMTPDERERVVNDALQRAHEAEEARRRAEERAEAAESRVAELEAEVARLKGGG